MSTNDNVIGNRLEEIRALLDIEESQHKREEIEYAWYVGACGYNDEGTWTDFSESYISEGRWENRWDDKFIEDVKSIKVGDLIALKASYTKKKGLPFNNNGKTVSVMGIKATGVVTENIGDGKNLKVNWSKISPIKEWYGAGVLRATLHLVKAADGYIKKSLLAFTFNNQDQDLSICKEQYKVTLDNDETENSQLIITDNQSKSLSVEELGSILTSLYNDSENKTTAIHMFGLKYAKAIKNIGASVVDIVKNSDIPDSYQTEVSKGIRIYEAILNDEYGIRFANEDDIVTTTEEIDKSLPELPKRTRKSFELNSILYGAPGTGKTYATAQYALAIIENKTLEDISSEPRSEIMKRYNHLIKDEKVVFTTFHQNYGYEDFIQGIRPDTSAKEMYFKTVDGVFKSIAEKAMTDSNNDYVIIIDEINRANISKVFGELITLIEEDKRWGEENAVSVTLPSGEIFAIPNNLYIVGTMNSADKSISLIDTALRRRFKFIEFTPDLSLIDDTKLKSVLEKLNKGIAAELNSTDLLIGHSYFISKSINDICEIMNGSIIPLLYEYFFDNKNKVEAQLKTALEGIDVEIKSNSMGRIKIQEKEG